MKTITIRALKEGWTVEAQWEDAHRNPRHDDPEFALNKLNALLAVADRLEGYDIRLSSGLANRVIEGLALLAEKEEAPDAEPDA